MLESGVPGPQATAAAPIGHWGPRVEVARSVEDVEAMREAWEAACVTDVDSDIDFFLTVVRSSGAVIRPHVIRIRRPASPDIFAIARLEEYPLRLALAYRTVARPRLRALVVTFGGIVGADTPEDFRLALRELRRPIQAGHAEALVLRRLDRNSWKYDVASQTAGLWRIHGLGWVNRWTAEVPADLDTFLASRSAKSRQTVRRQDRRLVRTYDGAVRVRRFSCPTEAADLVRDTETVAARTYQRGLGVGFHADQVSGALTELGLRRGWLQTWMLYIREQPVAFWTGTTYAGTFTVGTPGFDPAYAKDSVGRYTMHRMIEDVCADGRVTRLDLGQGDAEYKELFRPSRTEEADLVLLARRPRPGCLGMVASALSTLNTAGKRTALRSTSGRRIVHALQRGRTPTDDTAPSTNPVAAPAP
jgi:hypothetical protein